MSFDIENFPTNETAVEMMDMVSKIYDKSYVGKWIFQAMGLQLQNPIDLIKGLLSETYPGSATWSLYLWEELYGITTNPALSIDERRADILAKRNFKRPMNPARIESLIADLTGREVELRENTAPHTYEIVIYDGETTLDMTKVRELINEVKQSGKVVVLKLAQKAFLAVKAKRNPWPVYFRLCGTYPNVSTALRVSAQAVNMRMETAAYRAGYPMAGLSGVAGQYPGTSTALATNGEHGGIAVSSGAYIANFALCGEETLA